MPHDNVKACEEVFGKLKTNHMMSPTLIQIDRINPWSPCSTAIITDFLDSGHGEKGTGGRSMKERWGLRIRDVCLATGWKTPLSPKFRWRSQKSSGEMMSLREREVVQLKYLLQKPTFLTLMKA